MKTMRPVTTSRQGGSQPQTVNVRQELAGLGAVLLAVIVLAAAVR
jgi:hypothetical protein